MSSSQELLQETSLRVDVICTSECFYKSVVKFFFTLNWSSLLSFSHFDYSRGVWTWQVIKHILHHWILGVAREARSVVHDYLLFHLSPPVLDVELSQLIKPLSLPAIEKGTIPRRNINNWIVKYQSKLSTIRKTLMAIQQQTLFLLPKTEHLCYMNELRNNMCHIQLSHLHLNDPHAVMCPSRVLLWASSYKFISTEICVLLSRTSLECLTLILQDDVCAEFDTRRLFWQLSAEGGKLALNFLKMIFWQHSFKTSVIQHANYIETLKPPARILCDPRWNFKSPEILHVNNQLATVSHVILHEIHICTNGKTVSVLLVMSNYAHEHDPKLFGPCLSNLIKAQQTSWWVFECWNLIVSSSRFE